MAVIGIDLGTTNSLGAVWREGKAELIPDELGNLMIPSVVAVDLEGNILVGQAAREEELIHPERCASNFKRFMGTTKQYCLGDREFTPEELSALVLRRIRETAQTYLGEEITECVISVPAYFNNDQRYATKQAAQLAGIYCERLINEPSAAALTAHREDGEERVLLVFDFGGGTLDISIVDCFENIVEITTIAGDNHLGGTDFDREIALAFCEEKGVDWDKLSRRQQANLLLESKRCKETLSVQNRVEMLFCPGENSGVEKLCMELDTEKLFHIGQGLFRRIKNVISRAIMDSGLGAEDISGVLLAGGSSRMPVVQMFLSRLFERDIVMGKDPDLLIARGIGIYTGIKERNEELKDILMTDVCPFSLGTEIVGDVQGGPGKMSMLIERNSILPCRAVGNYVTANDYQDKMVFGIFQGENYNPEQNLKLGDVTISVPRAPKRQEGATVTFAYDINGILEVSVVSNSTGEKVNATFVSGYSHLSEKQLAAKKERMEAMSFLTREEEERKAIMAMAERLYAQTSGELRCHIEQAIALYNNAWESKSPIRIRKWGSEVMRRLLTIEISLRKNVFDFEIEDLGLFEEDEEEHEK